MPDTSNTKAVLDGIVTRDQLARDLGCTERTIANYEHAGLPVIRRGKMRLYDVERVNAWLLGSQPKPRRGRRPRVA